METRQLGGSGFRVPLLSLGTGTFGGTTLLFKAWGATGVADATRMVDIALEAGLNMFDSADMYSKGDSEVVLGEAIKGRRDRVILSTKGTFRIGPGANDVGSSRYHLLETIETSFRRLGTDYIDLYQLHGFDALTPVEESLDTLDTLVRAGKIRYIGCSNFSGWHLMKSLAVSDRYGWTRYVAHQAYYSLVGRDFEWELMPLAIDQKVGTVVWSPLGWGRLTGKIRRGQPLPPVSRRHSQEANDIGPPASDEYVYRIVDVLDQIALETGKTVPQIAINWVLARPTVATVPARHRLGLDDAGWFGHGAAGRGHQHGGARSGGEWKNLRVHHLDRAAADHGERRDVRGTASRRQGPLAYPLAHRERPRRSHRLAGGSEQHSGVRPGLADRQRRRNLARQDQFLGQAWGW